MGDLLSSEMRVAALVKPHEEGKEGFGGSAKLQLQDATGFLLIHSSEWREPEMRKMPTAKVIHILIMMELLT